MQRLSNEKQLQQQQHEMNSLENQIKDVQKEENRAKKQVSWFRKENEKKGFSHKFFLKMFFTLVVILVLNKQDRLKEAGMPSKLHH